MLDCQQAQITALPLCHSKSSRSVPACHHLIKHGSDNAINTYHSMPHLRALSTNVTHYDTVLDRLCFIWAGVHCNAGMLVQMASIHTQQPMSRTLFVPYAVQACPLRCKAAWPCNRYFSKPVADHQSSSSARPALLLLRSYTPCGVSQWRLKRFQPSTALFNLSGCMCEDSAMSIHNLMQPSVCPNSSICLVTKPLSLGWLLGYIQ